MHAWYSEMTSSWARLWALVSLPPDELDSRPPSGAVVGSSAAHPDGRSFEVRFFAEVSWRWAAVAWVGADVDDDASTTITTEATMAAEARAARAQRRLDLAGRCGARLAP